MHRLALTLAVAILPILGAASAQAQQPDIGNRRITPDDLRKVAPALEKYTSERLYGDVWKRPGLSRRDRGLVSLAVLITRNQFGALNYYIGQALDNGLKPAEISELIVHLAFYAGFANAYGAIAPARDVFAQRGIGADQVPPTSPPLQAIDQVAEADRAARVEQSAGPVSPNLAKDTGDVLFKDLWLRPDLAPRDRSLVTVSSLIASGQFAQLPYHLNKAMDAGLTKAQASEVISHIAYYAGWPNAFSAVPVFKSVFDARPKAP